VATCYFRIQSSFIVKTEVTWGFLLTIAKAPKHSNWSQGEQRAAQFAFLAFHKYFRNKKKIL
jgi:hypothetical protein